MLKMWETLESKYYEELLAAPLGELTATMAHAKLLVLRELKAELQSLENDEKFLNLDTDD